MAELTNPHDRYFKAVFSQPEIAADFLANYLPEPIAALLDPDPGALELIEGSFVDPDLSAHFSDLLYRVALRDGEHVFVYVLLEHKSVPDPLVAFQVLRYKVRIWERLLQQGRTTRLVPIIPVVFYHGPRPWRVPLDFGSLVDGPEALRRYWPDFEYRLVDLSLFSEVEIRGEVLARAVMMGLRYAADPVQGRRVLEALQLIRQALTGPVLECVGALLRYVTAVSTTLTTEEITEAAILALEGQGEAVMATIAEAWIEEGRQKGLQQGMQEGLQQGIRTGLLAGIELALDLKFGAAGLALMPEVRAIEDVDKLRAVHAATITATSPEDVRAAY